MAPAPAYSWFLAVRYLLARWVNVLGMAGVAVAVWALIVVIAVFSGFIHEIRGHIRGATADLVLTGVAADTSYEAVRALLEADPDVVSTAPRLQHNALLFPYGTLRRRLLRTGATGNQPLESNFVNLVGVDPEREASTTEFRTWLETSPVDPELDVGHGRRLFGAEDLDHPFEVSQELHKAALLRAGQEVHDGPLLSTGPGILLSYRRLSRGERMAPGQLVDVFSVEPPTRRDQTTIPKIRKPFVVAGAYETGQRVFDELNTFVHIDVLRAMLGHDPDLFDSVDIVTEVAIRTRPEADLLAAKERLTRHADQLRGGVVLTWEEQNSVFLGAVDHERAMMKIVLFAVMMVAAFLIYATLHMMVMQKIKDIGILTSLGAAPRGIAAIFLVCGAVVAAIGCAAGAVLGFLSAHYLNDVNDWFGEHFGVTLFPAALYDLPRIPYRIEAEWVAQVVAIAFVLALLVAYFPARRAARMDPVKALSYE